MLSIPERTLLILVLQRWYVRWCNAKLPWGTARPAAPFDELQLGLYTPRGVYFWKYWRQDEARRGKGMRNERNGTMWGLVTQGQRTGLQGYQISVSASPKALNEVAGAAQWMSALDQADAPTTPNCPIPDHPPPPCFQKAI